MAGFMNLKGWSNLKITQKFTEFEAKHSTN